MGNIERLKTLKTTQTVILLSIEAIHFLSDTGGVRSSKNIWDPASEVMEHDPVCSGSSQALIVLGDDHRWPPGAADPVR